MYFPKSEFEESRHTYERRKEIETKWSDREKQKRELSVARCADPLTLAKFMVSVEAPITREPLVMLGEKLSEEGTSHSAMKKKKT